MNIHLVGTPLEARNHSLTIPPNNGTAIERAEGEAAECSTVCVARCGKEMVRGDNVANCWCCAAGQRRRT